MARARSRREGGRRRMVQRRSAGAGEGGGDRRFRGGGERENVMTGKYYQHRKRKVEKGAEAATKGE